MKEQWTIQQLRLAYNRDREQCQSDFELKQVEAMFRIDAKKLAEKIKLTRKLNPCELAIMETVY
jgi:hypothetical protein